MYKYFKNIAEKNSCQLNGVCSIHPSLNALYQVLLNELKEISFYIVKLKEFGLTNKSVMALCIESLSIFLINTNFNETRYLNLVFKLNDIKNEVKEKYAQFCSKSNMTCEIINPKFEIKKNSTISELIELSQNFIQNEQVHDKLKLGLFELITLIARISALNIVKIKNLDETFDCFDFEVIRFFALTNSFSIRKEKLIRRIKEFSDILLEIINILNKTYVKKYGEVEDVKVKTNLLKGHSILVSGDDLNELEKLLETIENLNPQEQINVYTNGELLHAHTYPYFKTNSFLKGHFGSNNAEYDFSQFDGSILVTQNFIQKIDSLYRGELFSSKIISFKKVSDILDGNYLPVVNAALLSKENSLKTPESGLEILLHKKEILEFTQKLNNENLIIIYSYEDFKIEKCENKKVIYVNQTQQINQLIGLIDELKERNIEITIFFSHCDLFLLEMILSLLNKNIDLNMANCPYSLINPHVIEALKELFDIKMIS